MSEAPREAGESGTAEAAEAPESEERAEPGLLRRLQLRPGTFVTLALAVAGVSLTWFDPFEDQKGAVAMVANKTGARRLFPTLVDADPGKATIEFQAPERPLVRMMPGPDGGHQLVEGERVLGPVDGDDFETVWSTLRMATIHRVATPGRGEDRDGFRIGRQGFIRVNLPDQNFTLSLGDLDSAGAGVYAALDESGEPLVVDAAMAWLVEQPTNAWLAERLLPVEAEFVTGLAWGDELTLERGDDGFWRVESGATPALLASDAVEFRLDRLLGSKLDPFVERETEAAKSLRPWLVVTSADGSSRALSVGGSCPGSPDRRLVDRGPGLVGCVPESELERWPLEDPDAGMIETRLIPHSYGRVVQIDLQTPLTHSLVRRAGSWLFQDRPGVFDPVSDAEVRRWYGQLARVEVAPVYRRVEATPGEDGEGGDEGLDEAGEEGRGEEGGETGGELPEAPDSGEDPAPAAAVELVVPGEDFEPDVVLVVHADSNETLRLACRTQVEPALCRRGEGPLLRVLGELPAELSFQKSTFAERRLVDFGPGEARELEILPQRDPPETVRQAVRQDQGVWQLDAPVHVDGAGAIDEVRLESLLYTFGSLRAEAWVDAPSDSPLRRLVAEIVPAEGPRRTASVLLFPGCVVMVEDHRPATISTADCEALAEDLVFDDPLRFWLERSRSVEIVEGGEGEAQRRVFLRRERDRFVRDDGRTVDETLDARLQGWIDWRSAGLRAGEPAGPVRWSLDVRRDIGPRAQIEIGEGWVRLRGADWYYVEREAEPEPEPTEP